MRFSDEPGGYSGYNVGVVWFLGLTDRALRTFQVVVQDVQMEWDGMGRDEVSVDDVWWQWSRVDLNGEWWMVGCFVVTRGFVIGQSWFETRRPMSNNPSSVPGGSQGGANCGPRRFL